MRHRIVPVRFVDEKHTGLTSTPRPQNHRIPHVPRTGLPHHGPVGRIDQVVAAVSLHRVHELRGDAHRDVEVRDFGEVFLAGNELQHVGMIDAQNAHVRPASRSPLLHRIRAGVIQFHERHRPRRHPRGAAHHPPLGSQAGERKAGTAARLMNQRHAAQCVVDAVLPIAERVFHRQHKAGRELTQRTPRVHQRW